MGDRCRGDQPVDVAAWSKRGDAAPFHCDPVGDRQDSIGVIPPQPLEPFREARRGPGVGLASESDATHDFSQGERAQIDPLRGNRSQPSDRFTAAAAGLGNNVRIDEIQLNGVATGRFGARGEGVGEIVLPRGT